MGKLAIIAENCEFCDRVKISRLRSNKCQKWEKSEVFDWIHNPFQSVWAKQFIWNTWVHSPGTEKQIHRPRSNSDMMASVSKSSVMIAAWQSTQYSVLKYSSLALPHKLQFIQKKILKAMYCRSSINLVIRVKFEQDIRSGPKRGLSVSIYYPLETPGFNMIPLGLSSPPKPGLRRQFTDQVISYITGMEEKILFTFLTLVKRA